MKFKLGRVENENGMCSDIIIRAKMPNQIKEILVGGGLIVGGVIYLTSKAFRNGSLAFEEVEYKALHKIGYIK